MITATAPKTTIANFLNNAKAHLDTSEEGIKDRDYHDHQVQLLGILADSLINAARLEAWLSRSGFDGQCQEDSSIGGIPCLSSLEIS